MGIEDASCAVPCPGLTVQGAVLNILVVAPELIRWPPCPQYRLLRFARRASVFSRLQKLVGEKSDGNEDIGRRISGGIEDMLR